MSLWKNLKGTTLDLFKIGKNKLTIDAASITSPKTMTVGDNDVGLQPGNDGDSLVFQTSPTPYWGPLKRANPSLSNLDATAINQDLIPDTNPRSLGSTAQLWLYLFLGSQIRDNTNATVLDGPQRTLNDLNSYVTIDFGSQADAVVLRKNSNTNQVRVFRFEDGGANYIDMRAPDTVTGTYTLTLPPDAGTPGQVLSTDGLGNTSWINAGGGGGGYTEIPANGNLSGTYQGNVHCLGNASITGNVVVRGNLYVNGVLSGTGGFSLAVTQDLIVENNVSLLAALGISQQNITVGGDFIIRSTNTESEIRSNENDAITNTVITVGGNLGVYSLNCKSQEDQSGPELVVGGCVYGLKGPVDANPTFIDLSAGAVNGGTVAKNGGNLTVKGSVNKIGINTSGQSALDFAGNAGDIIIGAFYGGEFYQTDFAINANEQAYSNIQNNVNTFGCDIINVGGNILRLNGSGVDYRGGDAGEFIVAGDVICRNLTIKGGGVADYENHSSSAISGGDVLNVQINGNLFVSNKAIIKPGDAGAGTPDLLNIYCGFYKGPQFVGGNVYYNSFEWTNSIAINNGGSVLPYTTTDQIEPEVYSNNITIYIAGSLININNQGSFTLYGYVDTNLFPSALLIAANNPMFANSMIVVGHLLNGSIQIADTDNSRYETDFGGTFLEVKGNVQCNQITGSSTNGFKAGDVYIYGNCHTSSGIQLQATSILNTGNGGYGGDIFIYGNVSGGSLLSEGGTGDNGGQGGNGGNITIQGNCIVPQVVIRGGDGSGSGGNGGDAGSLTVRGFGKFSLTGLGGEGPGSNANGGSGAAVYLGHFEAESSFNIRGGNGDNNGGNAGTIIKCDSFVDNNLTLTLNAIGGDGLTSGNGGNGGTLTFHGKFQCAALNARGGGSSSGIVGRGGNLIFLDGFTVNGNIDVSDGADLGAATLSTANVLVRLAGSCKASGIIATDRAAVKIRPFNNTTSVTLLLGAMGPKNTLRNGSDSTSTGVFVTGNLYYHNGNIWYRVAGTAA